MHTPAAAFAWELWSRNRPRLIAIIGLLFGFAIIYPLLCTCVGFNPAGSDPLEEIARMLAAHESEGQTTFRIFEILLFLFLVCGPWLAMMLSLLWVTWMFTLVELDPKTKALTFPGRLFTLPVSTPFLSWSLLLSGMASIFVLHGCWTFLIRLPQVEMFATYESRLGWLTLLALVQGLVWALDGWPTTRVVLVAAVFFCFAFSPAQRDIFQSPGMLPVLFLLGVVLARMGMQRVRHGQWQGWPSSLSMVPRRARSDLIITPRFESPARAQLWFEWRRTARPLGLYAAGLTLVTVAIFLVRRWLAEGPLPADNLSAFVCCLIAIPLFLHFAMGISAAKTDLPFLMNRPINNGELMLVKLKAAALSTVVAWGLAFAAACAIPLLGNFSGVLRTSSLAPDAWVVIGIGLVFLTWRFIPASLAFVLSGNRRFAELQFWILFVIYFLGGMMLADWARDAALWKLFCRLLPFLLASLVALKLVLAFLAFRLSLKRRLLSRSALIGYLSVWSLIVAGLLSLLAVLAWMNPFPLGVLFPSALVIVLLVPLARIGLCPITFSWNRHS